MAKNELPQSKELSSTKICFSSSTHYPHQTFQASELFRYSPWIQVHKHCSISSNSDPEYPYANYIRKNLPYAQITKKTVWFLQKKNSFLSILQGELDFIPLLRVGIGREKQGEVLDLTNRTDHFITNILAMHYMTWSIKYFSRSTRMTVKSWVFQTSDTWPSVNVNSHADKITVRQKLSAMTKGQF